MSIIRNVRYAKCPLFEMSVYELSVYEMSVYEMSANPWRVMLLVLMLLPFFSGNRVEFSTPQNCISLLSFQTDIQSAIIII